MKENLTPEESVLIDRYLDFYTRLIEGKIEPTTSAQKKFRAVVMGLISPTTPHEIAYLKYTNRYPKPKEPARVEENHTGKQCGRCSNRMPENWPNSICVNCIEKARMSGDEGWVKASSHRHHPMASHIRAEQQRQALE